MSQQLPASALQDPAILELPALPPPPGVIPNFTNPESKGESLIIPGAILLTLVIIAVANRAYTKLCIIRKFSWDDLTLSLSAIGAIASYGVCVWGIRYGVLGKHQYDLHLSNLLRNSSAVPNYVVIIISGPTLWVTKFTFALFYLQIFRPMRWLRICIYVGATLFTIFYWSFALAAFIVSSPRSGETWGEAGISPRTNNLIKTTVVPAVGGMIVDIWLFVLPLVAIYKLQLHSTRRIGLTIMFGTGLLAVAASAVNVYFRSKIVTTQDKTWVAIDVDLIYLIEVDAGIITACMPSFAKMLHHHLPPWSILKSRLNFIAPTNPDNGSKKNLVMVPKDVRPEHFTNQDYNRGDRPYVNDTISMAEMELQSLKSVKKYLGGAASKTFDDDEIYLNNDSRQAYS